MAKPKKKQITEEQIRQKAQEIYEERISKGIDGSPEKDWILAKEELGDK